MLALNSTVLYFILLWLSFDKQLAVNCSKDRKRNCRWSTWFLEGFYGNIHYNLNMIFMRLRVSFWNLKLQFENYCEDSDKDSLTADSVTNKRNFKKGKKKFPSKGLFQMTEYVVLKWLLTASFVNPWKVNDYSIQRNQSVLIF